jgi:hypothetical protein
MSTVNPVFDVDGPVEAGRDPAVVAPVPTRPRPRAASGRSVHGRRPPVDPSMMAPEALPPSGDPASPPLAAMGGHDAAAAAGSRCPGSRRGCRWSAKAQARANDANARLPSV